MKSQYFLLMLLSGMVCFAFWAFAPAPSELEDHALEGAWELVSSERDDQAPNTILVFTEKHFSYTEYNEDDPEFIGTYGGTYSIKDNALTETLEFSTWDKEKVGNNAQFTINISEDRMAVTGERNGQEVQEQWKRVDEGSKAEEAPLAGTWRITGRERDVEMGEMQRGARKTIKILSATRFQWAAINTETGEFSGTGGGTYSAEDGKYTENIEFFSRDDSRVGASLEFEFEVKGDDWHHKGKSSKGDPIYEIWSKDE